MNLQKLFEAQKVLDERIIKEHGLEGQDLLQNKILALLVELGECAAEWRVFKYWSKDREPRTKTYKSKPAPGGGFYRGIYEANPLLEEYVDALHFFLSIGLDLGVSDEIFIHHKSLENDSLSTLQTFNMLFRIAPRADDGEWELSFKCFVKLGKKLGFTWEQVEEAYFAKNKVNHARQDGGY